jgi:hypothetical protein
MAKYRRVFFGNRFLQNLHKGKEFFSNENLYIYGGMEWG